jgi:hypothetical protein
MTNNNIISRGIVNHWIFSDEYINIDLSAIQDFPEIFSTIDIVREDGEARVFVVTSKWSAAPDRVTLILKYEAKNNLNKFPGPEYNELWGTATININTQNWTGEAHWEGEYTDEWDGDAEVTIVNSGLIEEKKRSSFTKIERQQQRLLRQALLSLDKKCAISGEEMPEVLDAAHIIGAANGGKEVIENAILLRADLHRLLDSGAIEILPGGEIHPKLNLPENYRSQLQQKRLPEEVFARIAHAVHWVENNKNSSVK